MAMHSIKVSEDTFKQLGRFKAKLLNLYPATPTISNSKVINIALRKALKRSYNVRKSTITTPK